MRGPAAAVKPPHQAPQHHAPSNDGYLLPRTFEEESRINYQEYVFRDALGYLLHPRILPADLTGLKVADVGTGTGLWPIHLARSFPNDVEIHGFDITTVEYPPKAWLPANVRLMQMDILAPAGVPAEFQGRYDVVHARLLMSLVISADPILLAKNLISMLKPGGWLQWIEFTQESYTVETTKPGTQLPALDELNEKLESFMRAANRSYAWIPGLHQTLAKLPLGLVETSSRLERCPEPLLCAMGSLLFGAYAGFLPKGREGVAAAWSECRSAGAMFRWDPIVVLGRRKTAEEEGVTKDKAGVKSKTHDNATLSANGGVARVTKGKKPGVKRGRDVNDDGENDGEGEGAVDVGDNGVQANGHGNGIVKSNGKHQHPQKSSVRSNAKVEPERIIARASLRRSLVIGRSNTPPVLVQATRPASAHGLDNGFSNGAATNGNTAAGATPAAAAAAHPPVSGPASRVKGHARKRSKGQ